MPDPSLDVTASCAPSCLEGWRELLPCPHCREGCAYFSLETTPKPVCGTQGFVPCAGCNGEKGCTYGERADDLRVAQRTRQWPDGRRFRTDGNYYDDPWADGRGPEEAESEVSVDSEVDGLNPDQRAGVEHFEGPALVVAGAGSGKTRMLMARIARLIDRGVPASQICALTFTRKAATEMRNRVRAIVGEQAAKDLTVTTFHSLALGVCRDHPEEARRLRGFSIWDDRLMLSEFRRLLRDLWDEEERHGDKPNPSDALEQLSHRKAAGLEVDEEWLDQVGRQIHRVAADAIIEYEAAKRASNALDYDDLIWSVVRMFDAEPDILKRYQEQWVFLMVDEYQDTNNLQERLLSQLVGGETKNLMVVGDDDQSIYGFRGAVVDHILTFPVRYPEAAVIELGQNYRCSGNVLGSAAKLVEHNKIRRDKHLRTDNEPGWSVEYHTMRDPYDEARYMARMIAGSIEAGYPVDEHAVLVRTRRQFTAIQSALSEGGVPYVTVGALDFWQRADIKLILCWFQAIQNPADFAAAAHCFSHWPRIGAVTVQRWQDLSTRAGQSPWVCIEPLFAEKGCNHSTLRGKSIASFRDAYRTLVAMMRRGDSVFEMALWLYEETGLNDEIVTAMESKGKTAEEGRSRSDLRTDFLAMCPREEGGTVPGWQLLRNFLDAILANAGHKKTEAAVALTTIHSAKGLEWEQVWIAGMVECVLPYSRTEENKNAVLSPEDLEEERRLCYVAYTRAKKRLVLMRFVQRLDSKGKTEFVKPSRFLIEGALKAEVTPEPEMPKSGLIRVGGRRD